MDLDQGIYRLVCLSMRDPLLFNLATLVEGRTHEAGGVDSSIRTLGDHEHDPLLGHKRSVCQSVSKDRKSRISSCP